MLFRGKKIKLVQVGFIEAPKGKNLRESLELLLSENPKVVLLDAELLFSLKDKGLIKRTPCWEVLPSFGYMYFAASSFETTKGEVCFSLYVGEDGQPRECFIFLDDNIFEGEEDGVSNHFFAVLESD